MSMESFLIKKEMIQSINGLAAEEFPKYTRQLMNLANQNAGATRPRNVGQMSELFPAYRKRDENVSRDGWKEYYMRDHGANVEAAVHKIMEQLLHLRNAIQQIDEPMVRRWVMDLLVNKTYDGMYFQQAILQVLAERRQTSFRMANPREEALGIDGYVGEIPYSIKPATYRMMTRLPEEISCKMIYYEKVSNGIRVEVES